MFGTEAHRGDPPPVAGIEVRASRTCWVKTVVHDDVGYKVCVVGCFKIVDRSSESSCLYAPDWREDSIRGDQGVALRAPPPEHHRIELMFVDLTPFDLCGAW